MHSTRARIDLVESLIASHFFGACSVHGAPCNFFSVQRRKPACARCVDADAVNLYRTSKDGATSDSSADSSTDRATNRFLRVYRYCYQQAVLADEVGNIGIEVEGIQKYLSNGLYVFYVRRCGQPYTRFSPKSASCRKCRRSLHKPYEYCSIFCKLTHLDKQPGPAVAEGGSVPALHAEAQRSSVTEKSAGVMENIYARPGPARMVKKKDEPHTRVDIRVQKCVSLRRNTQRTPKASLQFSLSESVLQGIVKLKLRQGRPLPPHWAAGGKYWLPSWCKLKPLRTADSTLL